MYRQLLLIFSLLLLVDAGQDIALRGCGQSDVLIFLPVQYTSLNVTCRYLRPQEVQHLPEMEDEVTWASGILELGPVGAKFLQYISIGVPHFTASIGGERVVTILRSDNGETWYPHTIWLVTKNETTGEKLNQRDLLTVRTTLILTTDFPRYFVLLSGIRQHPLVVGPNGGVLNTPTVPSVQAIVPPNLILEEDVIGLEVMGIESELVSEILGANASVSPVVALRPFGRLYQKAITICIPPLNPDKESEWYKHARRMGSKLWSASLFEFQSPLKLLVATNGTEKTSRGSISIWEDASDVIMSPANKHCIQFKTRGSTKFWLVNCPTCNMFDFMSKAKKLYSHAMRVPLIGKFVLFAKRISNFEAKMRVFCVIDDIEKKALEHQEDYTRIAKSKEVEVLEENYIFLEFGGNLMPVFQSDDQPKFKCRPFETNWLTFSLKLINSTDEPVGKIGFMKHPIEARRTPKEKIISILKLVLPKDILPESNSQSDSLDLLRSGLKLR